MKISQVLKLFVEINTFHSNSLNDSKESAEIVNLKNDLKVVVVTGIFELNTEIENNSDFVSDVERLLQDIIENDRRFSCNSRTLITIFQLPFRIQLI